MKSKDQFTERLKRLEASRVTPSGLATEGPALPEMQLPPDNGMFGNTFLITGAVVLAAMLYFAFITFQTVGGMTPGVSASVEASIVGAPALKEPQ